MLQYLYLLRAHQPIGFLLLLWPCLIAQAYTSIGKIDYRLTLILVLGAFLMRSAGCIINDLIDQNYDAKVARTKNRPLANKSITTRHAVILLIILLLLSACLLIWLKPITRVICLFSLVPIIFYPWCKRITFYSQFMLGFTFNIGVLVAWVEVKNHLGLPALLLYTASALWTVGYDTIYAFQDLKDDLELGLKSTAIKFAEKTPKYLEWIYTFYSFVLIYLGAISKLKITYYCFLVVPIGLLYWQAQTLEIDNINNCKVRFNINALIGALILLSIIFAQNF